MSTALIEEQRQKKGKMTDQDFLTEKWVLAFLGWKIKTLQNRISEGADHPPFVDKGKERRYPTKLFWSWYLSDLKQPIMISKRKAS